MGIPMLSMVFHLLFLTYRGLQIGYVRVILALRVIGGLERSKKESAPYILRERGMREDEGDDAGDEEQLMLVAPVAHASGSDERPRHGKGKGLTGSFMSVMSKIAGSRNKRPDVAREVPAPTQERKKLIPSYDGHDRGSLKFRSRYMALTSWELTDAHVRPLASGNLCQASRVDAKELAGCWSLLEVCVLNVMRIGLAGFPRGTGLLHILTVSSLYSRPPYPASGGTQAGKQQDVRVEEYFCGGNMARGTFALIDRDMNQCSSHSTEFLHG
ncbi:hypothetical protein M9H77_06492 [Catharanthus roseus]|uniref:Uncharacterized protein n=1 Tax=Catharanthus roseus TaxID=4058 RepID=A0ACC0BSI9_CATRO|nr:hypothetical protein M9H77_06492 [Catharanthus roseus]